MSLYTLVGRFVVFVFIVFISCTFGGYALSVLWGWFIVPIFGTPVLGVVPAIGISLVVSFMTQKVSKKEQEENFRDVALFALSAGIAKPMVALCLGWVVHLFM